MEEEFAVAGGRRAQRQPQDAVHEVEGDAVEVEGAVQRVRVHVVADDAPGLVVLGVHDDEAGLRHVGDVGEGVVAQAAPDVHGHGHQEAPGGHDGRREAVPPQEGVFVQVEHVKLRGTDPAEFVECVDSAGVDDP